jgi:hypothetical protein
MQESRCRTHQNSVCKDSLRRNGERGGHGQHKVLKATCKAVLSRDDGGRGAGGAACVGARIRTHTKPRFSRTQSYRSRGTPRCPVHAAPQQALCACLVSKNSELPGATDVAGGGGTERQHASGDKAATARSLCLPTSSHSRHAWSQKRWLSAECGELRACGLDEIEARLESCAKIDATTHGSRRPF